MAETNYDILKIQDGASKKDIRQAYRNLVLKLIQTGVVMMRSSNESNVHMRICRLGKNIPTPLMKEWRRQNSILVIPMQTSVEKIFYCHKTFHVK